MSNPEFEAIAPGVTGDFFEKDNLQSMTDSIKKWTTKQPEERSKTREAAFKEIDDKWNIHYQIKVINKILQQE